MWSAWIVCWAMDERWVQIRPAGKGTPAVWCEVKYANGRCYCEHRGHKYDLGSYDGEAADYA